MFLFTLPILDKPKIPKKNYYGLLIGILIFAIPFGLLLLGPIKEEDAKNVIGIFIQVIGGIIGIIFSIFLLYIQSLSSNFGGAVYYIVKKASFPRWVFTCFAIILLVLVYLYFIVNLDNSNLLASFSVLLLLIGLYLLRSLYNWSVNSLSSESVAKSFRKEVNILLVKINNSLNLVSNEDNNKLLALYFENKSSGTLYALYNSLFEGYFTKLRNNSLLDAKIIIEEFFLALNDFIVTFRDKFLMYSDPENILTANSTFTSFFVHFLIKINRSTTTYIILAGNYELLNSIIYGYRSIIESCLKINYIVSSIHDDENPLLSQVIGSYNDLSGDIIKHNEIEGMFTRLRVSQVIGPKILASSYRINFNNFLNGLNKFHASNQGLSGAVLKEYIKNYIILLRAINNPGSEIKGLNNNLNELLAGILRILSFDALNGKEAKDLNLSLLYGDLHKGIVSLHINIINGTIDIGDRYSSDAFENLIKGYTDNLELFYENKLPVNNYLSVLYFCEMILNMRENQLSSGKRPMWLYFNAIFRLSKLTIPMETGREHSLVCLYMMKLIGYGIHYNIDINYKGCYQAFSEVIDTYRQAKKVYVLTLEMLYGALGLIAVLQFKLQKDYSGIKTMIEEYEIERNRKFIDANGGTAVGIEHDLNPVQHYLTEALDCFDKENDQFEELMAGDDFNINITRYFIRKFGLTRSDFEGFLNTYIPQKD